MLHHAAIEVAPANIEAVAEFFELVGFERVEPPAALAEYTWLEREGTQVHLMPEESPDVPHRGHLALVVPEFEATLARLAEHGFEAQPAGEHWGAARVRVPIPGGHRVELMAAPPS